MGEKTRFYVPDSVQHHTSMQRAPEAIDLIVTQSSASFSTDSSAGSSDAPLVQSASRPGRTRCATCERPQPACLCAWVAPVAHAVEVLILQHPLEVQHPKGSARLLHLSLPRSRLVTGEVFADAALLAAPFEAPGAVAGAPRHNLLLYPDMPQDQALDVPAPPALPAAWLREPARLRLIVLDGTWRKSRKMLYLSPPLQDPAAPVAAGPRRFQLPHPQGAPSRPAVDAGGDLCSAGAAGGRCGQVPTLAGGL